MRHTSIDKRTATQTAPSAILRLQVASGEVRLSDALYDPRAEKLPVTRLIDSSHGWWPAKTDTFLRVRGIWPTRRVGELGETERTLLASDLRMVEERH